MEPGNPFNCSKSEAGVKERKKPVSRKEPVFKKRNGLQRRLLPR